MSGVVTPFPAKSPMEPHPFKTAAPLAQPAHTHADVPQAVRNGASTLHRLAASLHGGIGGRAATPAVLDRAEEELVEIAERALALRAALVQERKRLEARR